jgi:hypothetical protein
MEAEGPAAAVSKLAGVSVTTAVPVPEGVPVVDAVDGAQAAMYMVNINRTSIVVIFFIILQSSNSIDFAKAGFG